DVDEAAEGGVMDGDDEAVQGVDGVVEKVDEVARDLDLPHAQPVEHVLEVVRELGDFAEAEHAGQPLERVDLAEDLVDELRPDVLPLRLEVDEVARQRVEELLGFASELVSRPIVFFAHWREL